MNKYEQMYKDKVRTVEQVLEKIESGMQIHVSTDVAEPSAIMREFYTVADRVRDVTVCSILGPEDYPHLSDPRGSFLTETYFYGPFTRAAHNTGNVSLVPGSISTMHRERVSYKKPNIFIGLASPMDRHGFVSMGMCVCTEQEALEDADIVILEINPNVPVVHGDTFVHISDIDYVVESDREIPPDPVYEATPIQEAIGRNIADLVEDGSTIQLGLGGIPDAAGRQLINKRDLGIHSEMFTPSMVDLYEAGVITGKKKNIDRNQMVCTLLTSQKGVFDFVNHNPGVKMMRGTYVNDPFIIMKNDRMVSVNTAIEADLTGQVFSETIRGRQFSGTGGASDFALGAHRSNGGKAIIALPSTKKKGTVSSIQPWVTGGGVVTIQRQTVDYIVTEYGAAPMTGRSIRDRVRNLIAVAHPDFREQLKEGAQRLEIW